MNLIPRNPEVPNLSKKEMDIVERVTFFESIESKKCDAIFVFSSTHELHWKKVLEAYQNGYADKIIITGGRSLTGRPHESWKYGDAMESDVIANYLMEFGVPKENIVTERKSTNSLENVMFALEVFDFSKINSLMVVSKSHVLGRQLRTLAKYIPITIELIPYTYDATYKGILINRENWKDSKESISRVWGEYLRIVHYGDKGDIKRIDESDLLRKYFREENKKE